ncbi:MAG: hypothetical protein H0U70_08965 [Tatlockia sp.]|nr:hypothetical protein [Tatlockia sp.]
MSDSPEQTKKKIEQEKRNLALAQANQDEQLKKTISANPIIKPVLEENDAKIEVQDACHFKIKSSDKDKTDIEKIIEDYKKENYAQFYKEDILAFPSQEEALNFFTKQATAEPARKFLFSQVDLDLKLTGFNLYSCGTKKLYQGTYPAIKSEIAADLKLNPDNQNLIEGLKEISALANPTAGFRTSMKEVKERTKSEEQAGDEIELGSINPFSTKPKPY